MNGFSKHENSTVKILLTGASGGIGHWLAMHLGRGGHEIWGVSRGDQSDMEARYIQNGVKYRSFRCDVGNWEQVECLGEEITREWGRLDSIICCAGTQSPIGPAMALDPRDWSRNIAQNLNGTYFTIRSTYHLLSLQNQRAKVICFSGGGATSPRENFSAYSCAKTAIVRLVENLSKEWRDKCIDINAIAPGAINTAMTDEVIALGPNQVGKAEYDRAKLQKKTGGGTMEKVGTLVEFLLSRESDGVSGKLLSAPWDSIDYLSKNRESLRDNEIFTLRRVVPEPSKTL